MRWAAGVIKEAKTEFFSRTDNNSWLAHNWSSGDLAFYADEWEAEDNAVAERERLVEQLAEALFALSGIKGYEFMHQNHKEHWRKQARQLLAAGWTKAADK
jgi:hypothetical protein